MKKVFLVFMSLMFIMCLAGCGEKEEKINIDILTRKISDFYGT